MPRRARPTTTTRSEHWLRVLVNKRPDLIDAELNRVFGWGGDAVQWVSPLAADRYAEYYDDSFLDVLGLTPAHVPLNDFWPRNGPRWDGLARTLSGRAVLVEAKAYVEEAADKGTQAGPNSKSTIMSALNQTREYLRVRTDAIWDGPFYQYANRIAHLYYLNVLNRIDAYLVFVCFLNAEDVPFPCSQEQWQGAIRLIKAALGLQHHRLSSRIAEVFIDTADLKEGAQQSG